MSVATDPKSVAKAAEEAEAKAAEARATADAAKATEEEGLKEVGQPAMDFIARALNQTTKPKKEKKPADGEPSEDPDEDEIDQLRKAPPKPAAKKKAAAPADTRPVFDEEKFGEAVGRAVARVADAIKPKETKKPEDELPDGDKRRVAVLRQMETQFGERYKGLSERYVQNLAKHKDYKAKWEAEHPGEEYDEDSEEHADFLDALEKDVAYEEDDYVDALTDLKLTQRMTKVDEQVNERLAPIEHQEKFVQHRPKIIETRDKIGNRFWERMGEGFEDVVDQKGGLSDEEYQAQIMAGKRVVPVFHGEVLQELAKSDPDTHAVVVNAAKAAEAYAAEVYMLDTPVDPNDPRSPSLRKFDPKNQMHQDLQAFVTDRENRMIMKPVASTADDQGRTFLPRADFNKLSERDRAYHWTFTHEDIGFLMAARIAKATQAHLQAEEEKFSRRAAARGVSLENASRPVKTRRKVEDEEDNENGTTRKPISPSTSLGPRLSPSSIKVQAEPTGGVQGFLSRAFGKR